jgi:hypothetical protein
MSNDGHSLADLDKLGDLHSVNAEKLGVYEHTQMSQRYRLTLKCEVLYHYKRVAVARREVHDLWARSVWTRDGTCG